MKEHVTKLYSLCAGDGALPAAACVGAVCVCCRTTTATAWYEVPGAELAGMPQVRSQMLTQTTSISLIISVPHLPAVLAGLQEVLGSHPRGDEQGRPGQRGGQH